jgi:hypothetical protein
MKQQRRMPKFSAAEPIWSLGWFSVIGALNET